MQGERKTLVLVGITILFAVHVFGVYWCYKNGDLIRPLVMLPPKEIPPFWHAIFVILVNGIFFSLMMIEHIAVFGAVMAHKCTLFTSYCLKTYNFWYLGL
jgi:hypothetical protein